MSAGILRIAAVLLAARLTVPALAWSPGTGDGSNGTHRRVNSHAYTKFMEDATQDERFSDAQFDSERALVGKGVRPAGPPLYRYLFTFAEGDLTMGSEVWVLHGGWAADQPEVDMGLRHFFDPANVSTPYLTDWIPGTINPATDARQWFLSDPTNLYSWHNGLLAYMAAMEDPDQHDRKLALALRALGQTMHGLGDMTVPAHVRNDIHGVPFIDGVTNLAGTEPIEGNVTAAMADSAALQPCRASLDASDAEGLFTAAAQWTQSRFWSQDTISDGTDASGPSPMNGFPPYAQPTLASIHWSGNVGWSNETGAPLLEKTLTYRLFGEATPQNFRYTISGSLAQGQANVLIPVAVEGCKRLASMFFPKLDLEVEARGGGPPDAPTLIVSGSLDHDLTDDPAWQNIGETHYKGTGRILKDDHDTPGGKLADVRFEDGRIDPEVEIPAADLAGVTELVLRVDAGCRHFRATIPTLSFIID
jgi:hypothetical protein